MDERKLIFVCAWCKKVEISKGVWELIKVPDGKIPSHGICPECGEKVRKESGLVPKKKSDRK